MKKATETLWERRYRHGALWGENASTTARLLLAKLDPASRVLDAGCGYGRDVIAMGIAGHLVTGIDQSRNAVRMARSRVQAMGLDKQKVKLLNGDCSSLTHKRPELDGLLSHRFLHLLDEASTCHFAKTAAKLIKPGGWVAISARNQMDFRPEQMRLVAEGLAEYRDRPGHLVNFFNVARFRQLFETDFIGLQFADIKEPESITNPGVSTHITIMVAQRSLESSCPTEAI